MAGEEKEMQWAGMGAAAFCEILLCKLQGFFLPNGRHSHLPPRLEMEKYNNSETENWEDTKPQTVRV